MYPGYWKVAPCGSLYQDHFSCNAHLRSRLRYVDTYVALNPVLLINILTYCQLRRADLRSISQVSKQLRSLLLPTIYQDFVLEISSNARDLRSFQIFLDPALGITPLIRGITVRTRPRDVREVKVTWEDTAAMVNKFLRLLNQNMPANNLRYLKYV